MKLSTILVWVLLASVYFQSNARIITTLTDGYWSDSTIWSTASVPGLTDSIYVKHHLLLDSNLTVLAPGLLFVDTTGKICGHYVLTIGAGVEIANRGIIRVDALNLYGDYVDADAGFLNAYALMLYGPFQPKGCGYSGDEFDCAEGITIIPSSDKSCRYSCIQFDIAGQDIIPVPSPQRQWFFDAGTPAFSTETNPTVCYNSAGIFNVMLVTSFNCRVWDTINSQVVITEAVTIADTAICPGDSIEIGESVYTTAGVFSDTLITAQGCDSIVTHRVIIRASGLCNVGIEELLFSAVHLHPNPFNRVLSINLVSKKHTTAAIEVFNALGIVIYSSVQNLQQGDNLMSLVVDVPIDGMYFLRISDEDKSSIHKIMKQ